jgi:uncharacterized RDD family membrane protein YckC
MFVDCTHCRRRLEFSGDRPSFCAYCGNSLCETPIAKEKTVDLEAPTLAPSEPRVLPDQTVPERVGGYRLVRALGRGGMGTVYEAEETSSGRHVALKLISSEFVTSRDTVERFRQEGRLASSIAHPRCVFVVAAEEDAGRPYIVMELMPGQTLQDLVKERGPLPPQEAIAKILDVMEGLHEAHRLGVVHRDVKPSNCFVDHDGRVKIGDFGLSKSLMTDSQHLTKTGAFLGTPLFASPEQVRGDPIDPQSDVYSVAATLYFLLTGKAPFQTGDTTATLARIVSEDPPSVRTLRSDIDPALDKIVLRGLARQREHRWRNLEDFRQALLAFLPGKAPLVGLVLRLGAYVLDRILLHFVNQILVFGYFSVASVQVFVDGRFQISPLAIVFGVALWFLYFGVLEGWRGQTLGKWLLQLRTCTALGTDPPGVSRALLRCMVLYFLVNTGDVYVSFALLPKMQMAVNPADTRAAAENLGLAMQMIAVQLFAWPAGILLMLMTMRPRNGYRLLHEFASGTRTIRLRAAEKRLTPPAYHVEDAVQPASTVERIGAFAVRGWLWQEGGAGVLFGQDPALRRDVLIWRRPEEQSPLGDARHDIDRMSRLRWVGAGSDGCQRWDAFVAPLGCPLTKLVSPSRPLSWSLVRPLLEQLTDELVAALKDGTLPPTLSVDQVWVLPNGGVQLLDMPVGTKMSVPTSRPNEQEQRCLAFLGEVAAFLLEGVPRTPATATSPIRAPLPANAARLLRHLLGAAQPFRFLRSFQKALTSIHDTPSEVTRGRRTAQLAVLAAFCCVGVGWMLFLSWAAPLFTTPMLYGEMSELELRREKLERAAAIDGVTAALPGGFAGRIQAAAQWSADQQLADELSQERARTRDAATLRLSAVNPINRQQFENMEATMEKIMRDADAKDERRFPGAQAPEHLRRRARDAIRSDVLHGIVQGTDRFVLWSIMIWPPLWIFWTFITRGGLSYVISGINLVRADGRPALRLQCAWRAILGWAPFAALCALSFWCQITAWSLGHEGGAGRLLLLSALAWYGAIALLVLDVAFAFWRPARTVNDWLAGTYLVPR